MRTTDVTPTDEASLAAARKRFDAAWEELNNLGRSTANALRAGHQKVAEDLAQEFADANDTFLAVAEEHRRILKARQAERVRRQAAQS